MFDGHLTGWERLKTVISAVAGAWLFLAAPAGPAVLDGDLERLLRTHAPASLKVFRLPEARDLAGDWEDHPVAYKAQADFNGDGVEDQAVLLIRRQGQGFQLLVILAFRTETPVVVVLEEQPWVAQSFGLAVVQPGRYKTARGKGYSVDPADPAEVELSLPAIDRFQFESWSAYWYWDRATRKFRYIQMSD